MVAQRMLVTVTDDLAAAKQEAVNIVERDFHNWRWFLLVRENATYKCRPTSGVEWVAQ